MKSGYIFGGLFCLALVIGVVNGLPDGSLEESKFCQCGDQLIRLTIVGEASQERRRRVQKFYKPTKFPNQPA